MQKYLIEKDLPLRPLLIMVNDLSDPPSLQDDLIKELKLITTPLLQPMDQQDIELFQHFFEVTEKINLTLKESWRDHLYIVCWLSQNY